MGGSGFLRELPGLGDERRESPFPQVVAWGSLALALLLFFFNTVPAVREREELRTTEDQLRELRVLYDRALADQLPATPGAAAEDDLQTVLVAIDRIGWTPDELRQSFPPPAAGPTGPAGDGPHADDPSADDPAADDPTGADARTGAADAGAPR